MTAPGHKSAVVGRPRRILHLLPDLERGGGQQVLLRSLRYLDAARYQHTVLHFGENLELQEPFAALARLVRMEPAGMRSANQVRGLLQAESIDVVHVNGTPVDKLHGTYAAWKHGVPVLWTLHGMSPDSKYWKHAVRRPHPRRVLRTIKRLGVQRLERYLDRRTIRGVLAVSDAVLASWQGYLDRIGIQPEQVRVSYNGVPLEEYDTPQAQSAAERLRASMHLQDAFPLLLMIGRINEGKGQHHLVHVLREVLPALPKARLLLAGDGDAAQRSWLQEEIRAAGVADQVLPLGNRNDIPALLALCDLYVFASASEGFPLSVLEALAAARPVAAYELPGLDRIVQPDSGRLVRPDRTALATAIRELCVDRDTLRACGARGREIVADGYSMQAAAGRLADAYESLCNEPAHV